MGATDKKILSLIEKATGKSDVSSIDFKNIDNTTKDKVDFKRVRGSVRLMSGKIKTVADVIKLRNAFLSHPLP